MVSSRNNALEFSSVGSIVINAARGVIFGTFGAIQFLKDSEINDLEGTNIANSDLTKMQETHLAGTVLYGNFTQVSILSGLAQVHKI